MNIKLSSKNLFWSVLNLILIVLLIFGLKFLFFGSSKSIDRLVVVQAEGKVVVSPDIANISFSVVTEGKDAEAVQKENTQRMNRAIEFVKLQGVDAADIKTAGYNLYPKYNVIPRFQDPMPPVEREIIGYTLTQSVFVKVRDLEKASVIVGGLPDAGINQISNISFSIDDPDKFLNEAREEAFKKARAKADAMAKQNGVRIKKVISFSDSLYGGPYPSPRFSEFDALGKGGSVPPQIEPGSQEVIVNVSVTYQIR